MLANMAWLGFVTFSGLRMFSYIPQIWRIAADKTGAAAISYTTWGLWTGANASTAVYAATSLHDVWLAFVSGVYAICCVTVIALTALKRSGRRIRVTSLLPLIVSNMGRPADPARTWCIRKPGNGKRVK
jgi:hypothetical protein